jgi:hypothetical protein
VDLQAQLPRRRGHGQQRRHLIYCTCSLQPGRPKQIASLLADRAPVQRLPSPPPKWAAWWR